jgi:uncharacterized protein (DUF608 family)
MAQVLLTDETFPVRVRLEAFNPLTPPDADSSGLPVVVLRYVVENTTDEAIEVSVCGNLANYIGYDGTEGRAAANRNLFRSDRDLSGIEFFSEGVREQSPQQGTMALALADSSSFDVTSRTAWLSSSHPFRALTDFWSDFITDGRVEDREIGETDDPVASLCATTEIAPRSRGRWTFLLTWRFPNRYTWTPREHASDGDEVCCDGECTCGSDSDLIGNYYARLADDAWEFARHTVDRLPDLEDRTARFVSAFASSDLPGVVKEAALFNLPPLRSQTSFRTPDGRFYGWEGCNDTAGCCYGANPHVWNYEHATALLFGELSRRMREVEFLYATDDIGNMSFRVNLPIARASEMGKNAADGQMGSIVKLYRDWKLSGSDELLRRLWPQARRALEFAWLPGSWDADRDGVMEGIQHNTTDLNFYGPNPMMAGWYLAALAAAAEMAEYLGDDELAERCRGLLTSGRLWVSQNLFNGEYFEQQIRVPSADVTPARGVASNIFMSESAGDVPPEQPATGCMTDQLIGQYMARMVGLPDVFQPKQIASTLGATYRYNFVRPLWDHANPVRAFAVNDEAMVTVGSYPRGEPEVPCFRFFENWTGVEYAFAANLIFAGEKERGLEVIRAVRHRFDGKKRNPFDEPECGRHYARAMASWSSVVAWTGFMYDGRTGSIEFALPTAAQTRWFFSNGGCWGSVFIVREQPRRRRVILTVGEGAIEVRTVSLGGFGTTSLDSSVRLLGGESIDVEIEDEEGAR